MLRSVCNRAKLKGCRNYIIFSWYWCPRLDHSQLWFVAKEHLNLSGFWCLAEQAIMDSIGAGESKGLTSIPCILWGRRHWCYQGPVHALWWHGRDGGLPGINLGQVCVHCILSKGPPYLKHSWSTLAPILQIHGRKWEATTYHGCPQAAHFEDACAS